MKDIEDAFKKAKQAYDKGDSPLEYIIETSSLCISKLSNLKKFTISGASLKNYSVFIEKGIYSRPFIEDMYISSVNNFHFEWDNLINNINTTMRTIDYNKDIVDDTIYTTIMSFCITYDLFKNASRKTPGTYYEIILGSILSKLLPDFERKKYIKIPDSHEIISTDIVFEKNNMVKLVIPAKITTRERIVQPYAHQRILNSIFGHNQYKSILSCVSETQRDKDEKINDICVPGTIALFQKHLAELSGIYYLDPPQRYLEMAVCRLVPVKKLSNLLCGDLPILLEENSPT